MTNSFEAHNNEYSSTYVVFDRNNTTEHQRLTIQDQMITAAMGGVLPEQDDPSAFRRVLDIGCGTGSWIIETAKTYPSIEKLIGIDISKPMVEYAREQARVQQVADRVEFLVMDALLILEFPYNFFDLVNLRFGISFLRTWDWAKLFNELQRVSRPGAVVRVTESEAVHRNNSPALTRLFEMWLCAAFRAGHLFEEQPTGLTAHLPELLTRHGIQHMRTRSYAPQFPAGTPEGQAHYEDMKHGFRNLRPFLARRGCIPKDYEEIYQQALIEMQQPDFCVTWNLLTVWGNTSRERREKAYDY